MRVVLDNKRVLTAAVGLPVLGAAVWLGGWPLIALVAVASILGMREYFAMAGRPGPALETLAYALGAACVACLGFKLWPAVIAILALALWLEQFDFLRRFAARGETEPPRGRLAAALLYVPVSLGLVCAFSPLETALVLAVVMAADTGAYYGGHAVGGPKVWPAVSPGKTWAGTVSGVLASTLAASCFAAVTPAAWPTLAVLGAGLAVISQFGDFFESALKRVAGVKDSGALLPGHGGLLDRVDGLLPAILAYAACRSLTGLAG